MGAATILTTQACTANAVSDSAAAISVVAVSPQQDDFAACLNQGRDANNAIGLNLSYNGVKLLRAYAVSVQFQDRDSGHQRTQLSLYVGDDIRDKDTWHTTVCGVSPTTDLATVRTQVDMMAFVDRTYAGPIMLRQSQHLVGTLEAVDYAKGLNPALAQVFARPASSVDTGNLVPPNDPSLPLSIDVAIGEDDSNTPLLILGARNSGAAPVLGIEFKTSYFDHLTGKFQRSVTTKAVCVVDGKLTALAPGARWVIGERKIPISADGALDNYVITVDAVSLADGSFLGARKSLEADELRGIVEGLQMARMQHAGS
jgi:hypothetical protein